jgi:prophage tail gpP-like protein
MPNLEFVTITVGGMEYQGWKSFSYSASAKSPERSFQIVGAKSDIAAFSVRDWLRAPCTISSNGTLVMTGEVMGVEITIDPGNHEIRVSGKSRGHHLVTNSVDHKTHEWDKETKTLVEVAQDVDKPGIGFSTDEVMRKLPKVRANVGDSMMHFLDKLARRERMFLSSKKDGGVAITRHGKFRHTGGIVEGDNLARGTAKFSVEKRVEKVKVKGHQPTGTGEKSFRFQAEATDPGARKNTTKVIVPKTPMTEKEAKELAEHLIDNRFGDSVQLQCELQGFRDMGGMIWEPGWLVWCEVPSCELSMELAINEITLHQDAGGQGSQAQLVLVHPAALGGKTSKSSKFNKQGSGSWRDRLESE